MNEDTRQNQELYLLTKRIIEIENKLKAPYEVDAKIYALSKRIEELENARQIQISLNRQFQADIATLQTTNDLDYKDIPLKENKSLWERIFK